MEVVKRATLPRLHAEGYKPKTKIMNTQDFEACRAELHTAAINFAEMFYNTADDDRMVSVIARLEVAAERFAEAKRVAPVAAPSESERQP